MKHRTYQSTTELETLFDTNFGDDLTAELEDLETTNADTTTAETTNLPAESLQLLSQLLKEHEVLKNASSQVGTAGVQSHYNTTVALLKQRIATIGNGSLMGLIAADSRCSYFTQLIYLANMSSLFLDTTRQHTVFAQQMML